MINYTIYSDDHLIFNNKIIDDSGNPLYMLINPVLSESDGKFGSLTYKAIKGSPGYEQVAHLTSRIKVYKNGVLYWCGRVLSVKPSVNNVVSVVCEDFLGVLNDSIQRPYSWNGSVSDFLAYLVNSHNAQMTDEKKLIHGIVCDISNSIQRESGTYESTWSNIKGRLLDKIGGYIWIEYDSEERAILYYSMNSRSQIHSRPTQEIKFAKNIINYNVEINANEFYTACIPVGATYEIGEGTEEDPRKSVRLTIADVNDGKDYLVNTEAAEIYGLIFAPISETTWNDITLASNLILKGQKWIQDRSARYIRSIDLNAADTSGLIDGIPEIEYLDSVQCTAPDFDEIMILKSVKRNLDDPYNLDIKLGDKSSSISGKTASSAASTSDRIAIIEADYVTTGDAMTVAEERIENSSTIQQMPDRILSTVSELYTSRSDFEEFSQLTSTQISQMPNEFQILFTQVLSGAGLSELTAYLRVLNGNLHLGRSNSKIKACLKNDILLFYTGADELASISTALAYFSAGKLYVKTVQIRSLTLGYAGSEFDIRIVGGGRNKCLFFSGRGEDI